MTVAQEESPPTTAEATAESPETVAQATEQATPTEPSVTSEATDSTRTTPATEPETPAPASDTTTAAIGTPPTAERRWPAVQAAYEQVELAKQELAAAEAAEDDAKTIRKGKETALEAARVALEHAIADDPEQENMPLFDGSSATATSSNIHATDADYAADPAPTEGPADYDFQTTFPSLIGGTANETFPVDDHKEVVKEQVDAYAEILDSKARLASGKHDNGEEITAKTRKKIEAFLAETQLQFDEGMKVYAEKFGPKAAEKLQRYV